MWLINTETLELEQFANHPNGQYAILSHRWEDGEVNFQYWNTKTPKNTHGGTPGYLKIRTFARKAAKAGFKYAWADTCCINKESSAELSEAINSMFKYYQDAAECYVYLSDLPLAEPSDGRDLANSPAIAELHTGADELRKALFAESQWFTRGWTLQEMIAPKTLVFFDSAWQCFGMKHSLVEIIQQRTGVPKAVLEGTQRLQDSSVACRMSWAAGRETSRIEDSAYSLFGLFDIHMPLLYGEGQAAFIRLQEEICRKTTDMSLFAWVTYSDDVYSGLFATSPENFKDAAEISCWSSVLQTDFKDEIAVTNRGIRFDNMSLLISPDWGVLLALNCWYCQTNGERRNVLVSLSRTFEGWVRCRANNLILLNDSQIDSLESIQPARIFVRVSVDPGDLNPSALFGRSILFKFSHEITVISAAPSRHWDIFRQGFLPVHGLCGAVHVSVETEGLKREEFLILCYTTIFNRPTELIDWREAYEFNILDDRHTLFHEVRDIIQLDKLCIKEGYDRMRDIQKILPRGSFWSDSKSRFLRTTVSGVSHALSLAPLLGRESTEGRDSWDVIQVRTWAKLSTTRSILGEMRNLSIGSSSDRD